MKTEDLRKNINIIRALLEKSGSLAEIEAFGAILDAMNNCLKVLETNNNLKLLDSLYAYGGLAIVPGGGGLVLSGGTILAADPVDMAEVESIALKRMLDNHSVADGYTFHSVSVFKIAYIGDERESSVVVETA